MGVMVNNNEAPPAGWAVLDHSYDDADLPAPFNTIGFDSNNIGASVWVYLPTGAMVAAIPTGLWKERAQFAFYYAAPNGLSVISFCESLEIPLRHIRYMYTVWPN
ncbi:Uncharacterised protein [Mycobacteroides abscessus subsp. abscessus]|nr:Uncharacterised protein [Mycobacteroides abscessus subsp. abscessus]